jgi:hypothetical protein
MAEPKVLSRDDIRSAAMQAQIATEPMTVPELGGVIYVRGMSGKGTGQDRGNVRIRTAAAGQPQICGTSARRWRAE